MTDTSFISALADNGIAWLVVGYIFWQLIKGELVFGRENRELKERLNEMAELSRVSAEQLAAASRSERDEMRGTIERLEALNTALIERIPTVVRDG